MHAFLAVAKLLVPHIDRDHSQHLLHPARRIARQSWRLWMISHLKERCEKQNYLMAGM